MGNKELKGFHSENRTHVTKQSLKGTHLNAQNTASAPFSIKIFGSSTQEVSKGGKNLFDIERYTAINNPDFEINAGRLTASCTWERYINYKITGLNPGEKYTLSFRSSNNGIFYTGDSGKMFIDRYFTASANNTYVLTANSTGDVVVYFRNSMEQYRQYDVWDIQLEEGTTKTAFEPFVKNSPSKEYPSEILPLKNVKLYAGDLCVDIPFVGYEGDYLEYDDKTKVLKRVSVINEEKLDFTKPIAEQNANFDVPKEQILYKADGYDFSELKTLQGECEIYTDGGAYLEAEVKTVRRA